MKRNFVIGGLIIVAATNVISQIQTNSALPARLPRAAESSKTNAVLGVEHLMKNVDHYRGHVRVQGVVSVVSATNKTLGLIDVREFQKCGLEPCAEFTLPVRWTGPMPAAGHAIRVGGEVQKTKGKLVFVAKSVEQIELPGKGTR